MSENKINVVVAIDFSDDIIAELREVSPRLNIERHFPDVRDDVWATAEVLYTAGIFPEPEKVPLLRWIQLNYAGMDKALQRKVIQTEDIVVTSASGIHMRTMANYCLMMMMAFNWRLREAFLLQSKAEWPEDRFETTFLQEDMESQTVGIVGYGSIGREIARLCSTLGMTVLASKRNIMKTAESDSFTIEGTGDPSGDIPDRIYPAEAIQSMAKDCDYLVVTVPLTPETDKMINEDVFKAMKDSAVLINVARGGVVDEKDLISALASGMIRGAALDVFETEPLPSTSPLWNLDNVIITPHISGYTANYHQKAANLFKENLRRYLDNRPLLNQLDRKTGY